MNADFVLYLARRSMETAVYLSGPVLIVTLVVGFVTSLLQAVTSIRDMTLGMVVKLACVGLTLLVAGGWMLDVSVQFTAEIFNYVEAVGQ